MWSFQYISIVSLACLPVKITPCSERFGYIPKWSPWKWRTFSTPNWAVWPVFRIISRLCFAHIFRILRGIVDRLHPLYSDHYSWLGHFAVLKFVVDASYLPRERESTVYCHCSEARDDWTLLISRALSSCLTANKCSQAVIPRRFCVLIFAVFPRIIFEKFSWSFFAPTAMQFW